jgi:hypothetical protein
LSALLFDLWLGHIVRSSSRRHNEFAARPSGLRAGLIESL